jgi:hypothetical protein
LSQPRRFAQRRHSKSGGAEENGAARYARHET